jgi:hypothetical protein
MADKTTTDLLYNLVANPTKVNKVTNDSPIAKSSTSSVDKKKNTESPNYNFSIMEGGDGIISPIHQSPRNNIPSLIDDFQVPIITPVVHQEQQIPQIPHQPTYFQSQPVFTEIPSKEDQFKKIELLRKLSELKAKGYNLTKEYNFSSSISEMEYEYQLLRSYADKRNGLKLVKNGLLQCASVMEFLNDKYDPFDFNLSGWSENLTLEVDNWDDLLEELYEKYKSTDKSLPVEARLIMMICTSAFAFHFSKSYASKIPGLDSLLAANPALLSKLFNTSQPPSTFVTPQEINITKQKEKERNQERNQSIVKSPKNLSPVIQHESPRSSDIESPKDNIKSFLSKVHSAAGINRVYSETTISDSNNNRPKRGRPPKQSDIATIKIL